MVLSFIFWPCFYTALSVAIVLNVQGAYMQAGIFLAILPLKIILSRFFYRVIRRNYAREIERRLEL